MTVTFSCRHPWHNAPKEVGVNTGAIELSLYPEWAEPLEWYRGVGQDARTPSRLPSGEA